jgi:hypothetical protein
MSRLMVVFHSSTNQGHPCLTPDYLGQQGYRLNVLDSYLIVHIETTSVGKASIKDSHHVYLDSTCRFPSSFLL